MNANKVIDDCLLAKHKISSILKKEDVEFVVDRREKSPKVSISNVKDRTKVVGLGFDEKQVSMRLGFKEFSEIATNDEKSQKLINEISKVLKKDNTVIAIFPQDSIVEIYVELESNMGTIRFKAAQKKDLENSKYHRFDSESF